MPTDTTQESLTPAPRTLSPARLEANRANAQKSTGPRTPAGKARSALNSLTHGLTAHTPLKPGEDPTEFLLFQDGLLEELNPLTLEQFNAAQALIEVSWKLHRYRIAESRVYQEDEQRRRATVIYNWERQCERIQNGNLSKRRHERDPLPEKPNFACTSEDLLALSFFATDGRSPLQLLERYRSSLLRQFSKLTREYRELKKSQNEPTDDGPRTPDDCSPPTDDSRLTTDNAPLPPHTSMMPDSTQNEPTEARTAGVSPAAKDVQNQPTGPSSVANCQSQIANPLNPEPRTLTPEVQIEPTDAFPIENQNSKIENPLNPDER